MNWFSAKILSATAIDDDLQVGGLCEVSIRILKAASRADALIKAEEIGRDCEHSYWNAEGERVTWRFMRVLEVLNLQEQSLEEGDEIFSKIYLKSEFDELFDDKVRNLDKSKPQD